MVIELHEEFNYDYENQIARIENMVGLCCKCHDYIHQGSLKMRMVEGKTTKEYVDEVIFRGDKILAKYNLKKQQLNKKLLNSLDWKLLHQNQDLVELMK